MKKTLKIIGKVISWAVTAFAAYIFVSVLVCIFLGKLPTVFNRNYFIVQTDSMSPTIQTEELIISKKCDIDDVKEGDIITFTCIDETQVILGQVVTHRVIHKETIDGVVTLTTRGDNPRIVAPDTKKVTEMNFIGIVTNHSKPVGKFVSLLTKKNSFFIFLFVIGILFFVMTILLKNIVLEKKKVEEEKRKQLLREELLLEIKNEQEQLKEETTNEKD